MSRNGEQGLMASRRRMWYYQKRQQRTEAEPGQNGKGTSQQTATGQDETAGEKTKG